MRDELDETYTMAGGSTVQFRGFTLTFGEGIVLMDRREVITLLGNIFHIEDLPDPDVIVLDDAPPPINTIILQDSSIGIVPVPEGIRLTIKDIRFVPDSAEFLPEERGRLDLIAEALRQIPDRTFLVEGHTASTGLPAGEMQLSIERAEHMVAELVRRGISADRFIYKGGGGTRPIGDNSTNAGRGLNRRVEITILE
jgi:outer membrane protein OmpA-like peptidoglycan-associated protein